MKSPCYGHSTDDTPKRVLMICCAFPPTGGPGVQRSVKFVKYLPSFGWLPTVWASEALEQMPRDDTLLADIPPEATVHRQPALQRLPAAKRITRWMTGAGGVTSRVGAALDWRVDAWLARTPTPDPFNAWAQASAEPLMDLIRREGVDVLYSTFSPASNHVLALALKRRTNLPWVADFRDLWTDDYRYNETSHARRAAHRALEQEILETADVVIGVTQRQTAVLAEYLPSQHHKFYTITNGFDPDDIPDQPARHKGTRDRFVLAHVGRFDRWRTEDVLFEGLKHFVDELGQPDRKLSLRIVGHADESTLAEVRRAGVECSFTGYVSHADAIKEMQDADALLLCVPGGPNGNTVIPAKLFEYLAVNRPILAVGPRGGMCESFIKTCEAGICAELDAESIAAGLVRLYDAWRSEQPLSGCPSHRLAPFSRIAQTRELATLFDGLVGRFRGTEQGAAEPAEVCTP